MKPLPADFRERLMRFAQALVNQREARVLIPPNAAREGFWFGGGNIAEGPDGAWYLVGRYRDEGDSRIGLGKGARGLELALFRSTDRGATFSKVLSFGKHDLAAGEREVVSIEGAKLRFHDGDVELYVSTEKNGIGYPPGLESYLKPGTGVWTIDLLKASSILELKGRVPRTIIEGTDPRWLHAKDPVIFDAAGGATLLYFCTHPFNWSSSNAALAVRRAGAFPRGYTWDVAIARITGLCRVPAADGMPAGASLVFYDGGESIRPLQEHAAAVKRPRGYSCEELGGVALMVEPRYDHVERLSIALPAFVSPHGTGCSRYVNVLETGEGYVATWQQSQPDLSQPLVSNFVSRGETDEILRG